ncbi:MAG: enoyl-CoA hydratase [Alphaproteobacteria bacterium]|jgi:enoyl-CoA hydratase/carnithine racemase|nr:enoyl-CoA hydratase [Alphaproteobacteria bacterium]MDP6566208.1 enoyl-CoA hydratase [Alphaproteobacteria bacterium]MDP6813992.1 enoyl-CoA hydratase [Alphaproteobacteria bacterium]
MQLNTDKIIAKKEDGIGWLIFNNPARRNAVSLEMWRGVAEVMADYAADDSIRVAVLAGAGDKAFVSGADISEFEEQRNSADAEKAYSAATAAAHAAMAAFEKPLLAKIHGFCVGGGVAVALAADIRIASDDAQFAVPAARLGLGYGYAGLKTLTNLVGPAMAKEIFFTARRFNAEEALAMGLVNRVVSRGELEGTVHEYAGMIADNAPLTIRAAKAAVREALKDPERRDLDGLNEMITACFNSEDYAEGRRAFMEKRRPQFQGR